MYKEIIIAGFGGQGVVMLGSIIAKTACIYENRFATMIRSFGPEARGGACNTQIIISDSPIDYPYIANPDVLVVLSQPAYERFIPKVRPGGIILAEEELVTEDERAKEQAVYLIPAMRIADHSGCSFIMNIIVLGFFSAITKLIGLENTVQTIRTTVPPGSADFNVMAFERGFASGCRVLREKTATVKAG